MNIYVIRHGHAEERENWYEDDLLRPLTEKGRKRAAKAFARYFDVYKKPDIIISSAAIRALETAEILQDIIKTDVIISKNINPGADSTDYQKLIEDYKSFKYIAFVGHEPDMSEFISAATAESRLLCEFKKGSICFIKGNVLHSLVQQKMLL